MADATRDVVAAIEDLRRQVRSLESRVVELEERTGPPRRPRPQEESDDAVPSLAALPSGTVGLLGRSLLVLAGAYLVRALTEGQVLPPAGGVALGLAWAVVWQILAAREAGAGRRASGVFNTVTSSLIAFPLIWETTARFDVLGPRAAFALVVAFLVLGLWASGREGLAVSAVLVTLLSVVTTVALLVSTHDLLGGLLALVAQASALEWLACHERWPGLRWLVAVALDGVAFLLVALVGRLQGLPHGYPPVSTLAASAALLALPALAVVGIAVRTLRGGHRVGAYDVAQGTASVVLGLGGAWHVLRTHDLPAWGPGLVAVLLGAGCYAVAFVYAERRPGAGRNFYFYATTGGLLTLVGTSVLGSGPWRSILWAGLGLAAVLLGRRFGRSTLRVHSAVYLLAAAVETGLLAHGIRGFGVSPGPPVAAAAWIVALATIGAYATLATDPGSSHTGLGRVPQLLLAAVIALALAGALMRAAVAGLGGRADPGVAAALGTTVLALVAVGLAVAAGRLGLPELGWLAYAIVVLGGAKLVLQDLRHGRPATLVLSLAVYGVVLLIVPRLLRVRED
jgi:hypothetical protein